MFVYVNFSRISMCANECSYILEWQVRLARNEIKTRLNSVTKLHRLLCSVGVTVLVLTYTLYAAHVFVLCVCMQWMKYGLARKMMTALSIHSFSVVLSLDAVVQC